VSEACYQSLFEGEVLAMTPTKANRKRCVLALAILGLAIAAISNVRAATPLIQNPVPVIGNVAPAIKLERLLQAPPNASIDWNKLKGKVVVLDFWATWCSPCIAGIPHLNKLATEFSGQPVVFIAITDDSEERLKSFLKTTPIKTWIGIDSERTSWSVFGIHGIPADVIVGTDGRFVGATAPDNLTTQILRDVIDGKTVNLSPLETRQANPEWDQDEIEWKDGVSPISEVIIKPISTTTSFGSLRPEGNSLTVDGFPVNGLVMFAYQIDPFRLDWRIPWTETPSGLYRVAARVPKGREQQLLPLFQNALAATFALKVHWEQEERDVYVLRVPANSKPGLTAATPGEKPLFEAGHGKGTAKRQPVAKLSSFLGNFVVHAPVVDETGLAGEYDWDLPYQPGQPNVALQALKDMLGLELVKTRRPVKMLVVERDETIQKH
jgi:uncharacterized protein (TIGR03435 family)